MPLQDHFRPPLSETRKWEDFHSTWSVEIRNKFNLELLPKGYYAAAQIHLGGQVEIDVATFEEFGGLHPADANAGVVTKPWSPPATKLTLPAIFPDEFEIRVIADRSGQNLVGAIELVSPGNKDRPEARRAFIAKCASYLQQGVGLLVVDGVTERQANLHDELMTFLQQPGDFQFSSSTNLYTTAYRPVRRPAGDQIDLWLEQLTIGERLPVMPRALRGGPILPIDLELTYLEVLRKSRW